LFVFNSCGGPAKPEGFPTLVRPVTVKVHKDGEPLSDVMVILHPKDSSLSFVISGQTKADGVAILQTSRNTYTRPGSPVGTFHVQLVEKVSVDMSDWKWEGSPPRSPRGVLMDDMPQPVSQQRRDAEDEEYTKRVNAARRIPIDMANPDSPLEIDISASVAAEFDVSKYASPKK